MFRTAARIGTRCPSTRQDATDECSCSMDFNLLFDEASGPLSLNERVSRRETGGTYVYLRVLKRMCVPVDDRMREVLDVAREAMVPLTAEQIKQRDLVIRTVQQAMHAAGCSPIVVTSRRAYGAGGVMCPQHTYLQVAGWDTTTHEPLIVEPLLRDAFQIVRSTEQYQRLLEAVPSVFVGTPSALTDLVEFMVARMEDSFHEQGMCCPPWRQVRSVLAKWGLSRSTSTPTKTTQAAVPNESNYIRFGGDSKRKATFPPAGLEPKELPASPHNQDPNRQCSQRRSSLLSDLRCRPGAATTTAGCTNKVSYVCTRT